ncbi:MAG TPA: hypothetical protein VEI46_03535 [Thermodesulfovibrionales bacterium]|nr:hypothetical protein [Thermodesulfovibrionales bacterium]
MKKSFRDAKRRAAYFLARTDYLGRPLDDGVIHALLKADFVVDLFVPGDVTQQTIYPFDVNLVQVDYRVSWLWQHMNPRRWRRYHLFLGTCDLPMAFAGILAWSSMRPVVTVCDEIYAERQGPAVRYWKFLSRLGMRRSKFTVIPDLCRTKLQRDYARLDERHLFVPYPCSFPSPIESVTAQSVRQTLGIGEQEFVVSLIGGFHHFSGAPEAIRLLDKEDIDICLMIQTGGVPEMVTHELLKKLALNYRVCYLPERVGWREAAEIASAGDIGLVFYNSPLLDDQTVGLSSQKLCTFLFLGKPVVASSQASFEFIEQFQCGVLIKKESDLLGAINRIRNNYAAYAGNAVRCVEEYIQPMQKLNALSDKFKELYP